MGAEWSKKREKSSPGTDQLSRDDGVPQDKSAAQKDAQAAAGPTVSLCSMLLDNIPLLISLMNPETCVNGEEPFEKTHLLDTAFGCTAWPQLIQTCPPLLITTFATLQISCSFRFV